MNSRQIDMYIHFEYNSRHSRGLNFTYSENCRTRGWSLARLKTFNPTCRMLNIIHGPFILSLR